MAEERDLTAKNVREAAGLSYRQLNDWDGKGLLPKSPGGRSGWRKYTPKEVFALMVMSELRKKFGIPLERLSFIRDFMLREKANHLAAAVDLIGTLGVSVYIMTDLEKSFVMDSELEFHDMMGLGYFGGEHDDAFVFLKVNPLVNRMLSCLKDPIRLEQHGRGWEVIREIGKLTGPSAPRTRAEQKVRDVIETGDFSRIEITGANNGLRCMYVNREVTVDSADDILKAIEEDPFQKVTVVNKNGKVHSVVKNVTTKFSSEDNEPILQGTKPTREVDG